MRRGGAGACGPSPERTGGGKPTPSAQLRPAPSSRRRPPPSCAAVPQAPLCNPRSGAGRGPPSGGGEGAVQVPLQPDPRGRHLPADPRRAPVLRRCCLSAWAGPPSRRRGLRTLARLPSPLPHTSRPLSRENIPKPFLGQPACEHPSASSLLLTANSLLEWSATHPQTSSSPSHLPASASAGRPALGHSVLDSSLTRLPRPGPSPMAFSPRQLP